MKTVVALAFSVLLLVPAAVAAHEGHDHKILGTVASVRDHQVEVRDVKGKVTLLTLGATTKIRRDKMRLAATDLKVGDRVVATTRESKGKDGKPLITVVDVQVGVTITTTTKTIVKQ
jgi:hypothetical protein